MSDCYTLANHVHACLDGDAVIFLDLKRDRYVGARASDMACLLDRVDGLPALARAPSEKQDEDVVRTLLARLMRDRLIEPRPHPFGLDAHMPVQQGQTLARPHYSMLPDALPRARAADAPAFVSACLFAAIMIKRRRLDLAVKVFAARKRRRRAGAEMAATQEGAARFLALRPWFPARRVCLFDSFALMHFMTGLRLTPALAFAVRAHPFSAHCWVESQGVVLNDRLDNCRWHAPILKV